MSLKNYSRAERRSQIVTTLLLRIQRGQGDEMTMYQMAHALGMKPSGHLANIMADCVVSGKLKCRRIANPGKWDTFYYSLSPDFLDLNFAPKKREIAIKANGKQVGQLELF